MEQGSTRGTKQRYIAARTALSRTAPNNTNLLSSRRLWRASQRITLLVTGAAYSIELIRDFVTITLELATVGMVVMWIDPRPWSGCLSSVARSGECQHWSDIEVWWPNTWVSAQSVVAINVCCPWWLSQIWRLLVASPHPTGHLPLGWGHCSRLCDVTTRGDLRVWMPPLETAWPLSQILRQYLSGYLYIWRLLVQVRLALTPKNPPILGLLDRVPID